MTWWFAKAIDTFSSRSRSEPGGEEVRAPDVIVAEQGQVPTPRLGAGRLEVLQHLDVLVVAPVAQPTVVERIHECAYRVVGRIVGYDDLGIREGLRDNALDRDG